MADVIGTYKAEELLDYLRMRFWKIESEVTINEEVLQNHTICCSGMLRRRRPQQTGGGDGGNGNINGNNNEPTYQNTCTGNSPTIAQKPYSSANLFVPTGTTTQNMNDILPTFPPPTRERNYFIQTISSQIDAGNNPPASVNTNAVVYQAVQQTAQQTVQQTIGTESKDNGSNSQTKIQNAVPTKTITENNSNSIRPSSNSVTYIKYLTSTLQTSFTTLITTTLDNSSIKIITSVVPTSKVVVIPTNSIPSNNAAPSSSSDSFRLIDTILKRITMTLTFSFGLSLIFIR
ncbi:8673_t:CDS:2 [Ambispora gerdemannii]|uniref:8673_t:CDS:1 n=1 Tax=Ambispora gerdemannii TaxID=144530 RepID=A0A9N9A8N5_9GLOM|nr:8673_t:CDS:2 [Ambispora gerdemannii]